LDPPISLYRYPNGAAVLIISDFLRLSNYINNYIFSQLWRISCLFVGTVAII